MMVQFTWTSHVYDALSLLGYPDMMESCTLGFPSAVCPDRLDGGLAHALTRSIRSVVTLFDGGPSFSVARRPNPNPLHTNTMSDFLSKILTYPSTTSPLSAVCLPRLQPN